jgi:hypothetical protein
MDEREQLQQIETGQFRITEPLSDQRSIQDDVRSLGGPGDGFAPRCLADLSLRIGDPDSGVGCVKRGKRQRSSHFRYLAAREQKSNAFDR